MSWGLKVDLVGDEFTGLHLKYCPEDGRDIWLFDDRGGLDKDSFEKSIFSFGETDDPSSEERYGNALYSTIIIYYWQLLTHPLNMPKFPILRA